MKKNYYLFALLLSCLLFCSCGDDTTPEPTKSESAIVFKSLPEGEVSFDIYGGTKTFEVETRDIQTWSAKSGSEWVELLDFDPEKNTFTLQVGEAELTKERTDGKIIFSAEGIEDITLKVKQEGLGLFCDRSSRMIMNLKGRVKSVANHKTFFLQDGNLYLVDIEFENLEYNYEGLLTNFIVVLHNNRGKLNVDVTYDAKNRIEKMSCIASLLGKKYDLIFEYDNHGYYLSAHEILEDVVNVNSYSTFPTAWFPMLIKDLGKVIVEDYADDLKIVLTPDYSISQTVIYHYDARNLADEVYFTTPNAVTLQQENGFTIFGENRNPMWECIRNAYEIDIENGMKTFVESSYKIENIGSEVFYAASYNTDRINSLQSFTFPNGLISEDEKSIFETCYLKYNDGLDLIEIQNCFGVNYTFTYEYDEKGNWIKRTAIIEDDEEGSREEVIERTIIYYE